ncbi:ABC transporter ATP-binding protein [Sporomusa sphaeroides]|uniref:Teichoic acids export ATP-binding protein TagH n=1 Tax=Sporomusa sphaeroides DSM 2875 TaxID=1337886 RepID=A0ABM9W495_9FIRM|nr:ABC transporter ATP-binding protein [Sporomusa sphaeroides]OLS55526.1 teichoic acids export ATP-binding protein TagH [Sporomusa sphaeroides DSM 2875]CVK19937.1 Teichoic acids export ATP-binding protein TagH [Sporomusa sphaeroides DSM 2875]
MSDTVIKVENLSKQYQLGTIGSGTLYRDLQSWWARLKGKEDPNSKLGQWDVSQIGEDNSFWALRDVSFEINQGDIVGIIGRNGAGKSTLLKILSRVTGPTSGQIKIKGRVASLLEVGTGFHPELTGRENVYLNGAILGMRKAEIDRKFDEIVDFAEISKFIDTPVKRYSSGMYVRLAFAVAAHLDPEILIVDEVLAVGDIEFQKKCLGKMKDVGQQGRTVLFVSHNMVAIEQLCSSAILIENGQIKSKSFTVRDIIKDYLYKNEYSQFTLWENKEKEFSNPYFYPVKMYIGDKDGKLLPTPIRNDQDAFIFIEAQIKKIDKALTVGYAIYTDSGECLYWSYQTDESEEEWPTLIVGSNVLYSNLPKRLLNEGKYRIELIGGVHFRKWLFQPLKSPPSISLEIVGGLSDSPYLLYKRPTVLNPIIRWNSFNRKVE